MSTSYRRHVLVVASQCRSMAPLTRLDEAALSLRDIFLDPDIGGCEPGLPSQALLHGKLPAADIEARITEAISYAAAREATLILALLGHGFIPGTDPSLYLMGWESAEGIRDSAVDVRRLLISAADRPGIRGVVGLIDTCTAAAALPPSVALSTGTLNGQTQLSLLMASAVEQPAYDLSMSRGLADLLRVGVAGVGPRVQVMDVVRALRAALPGQDVVSAGYDGDQLAEPLWLAHNQHVVEGASTLGSYAAAELSAALTALYPDRELPADWDAAALGELRQEAHALPSSPARTRAVRVLDNLIIARKTIIFLRSFMPDQLSTPRLRRALAVAAGSRAPLILGTADAPVSDVDAVERMALTYPRAERSCRDQLTRFVLELVDDAGLDPGRRELRDWAESIDAIVPLNDALAAWQQRHAERRLRLIVSLHYALAGDWPETLGAWLLYDDEFYQHQDFPCTPDQPGAEEALTQAVDWAEEHAMTLGAPLHRLEVAMPVRMLLRWRPEEIEYGPRLGVNYDVLPRWSQRLDPQPTMRRLNRNAGRRLAEIAASTDGSRLHWLAADQVRELTRLCAEFRAGRYTRAIGLIDDPGGNEELFEVVLQFAPILLWPQTARLSAEHRELVDSRWSLLPAGLLAAYRARWRAEAADDPIADLRAVWDDEDWLKFCRELYVKPGTQPRSS